MENRPNHANYPLPGLITYHMKNKPVDQKDRKNLYSSLFLIWAKINPQVPVAQKTADEVVYRRFQGEGVEFFFNRSSLTNIFQALTDFRFKPEIIGFSRAPDIFLIHEKTRSTIFQICGLEFVPPF